MGLADLADEVLHLELRARVEARRRLVEQQQDRLRQERAGERDLLLHPAREVLHRLVAALGREADALEDLRDPVAGLADGEPVEAGRVGQVLGRRHLLEEGRLDRDAVDEPAHGPRVGDVVAEQDRAAAVVDEQRREQPDQRRLPRAVLAEDGDTLAARDVEGDAAQGVDPLAAAAQAGALAVATAELLAQVVDFDCRHVLLQTRHEGTRKRRTSLLRRWRAQKPESAEAQHCAARVPAASAAHKGRCYRGPAQTFCDETAEIEGAPWEPTIARSGWVRNEALFQRGERARRGDRARIELDVHGVHVRVRR